MTRKIFAVLLGVAILAGLLLGLARVQRMGTAHETTDTHAGEYAYRCDNETEFYMLPSTDMTSIRLKPIAPGGNLKDMVLREQTSQTGARFESGNVIFLAHGESVQLSIGGTMTSCAPMPRAHEAPFNFGD